MFKDPVKINAEIAESCDICGRLVHPLSEDESQLKLVDSKYCSCHISQAPQPAAIATTINSSPTASHASNNRLPDLGDRYQILELIGQGGMGTVYKVRDKALAKDFAVKILNQDLVQDKISVKRFEQEAKAASTLTHPNLAAVYGFGMSTAGSPFLVMDYSKGATLEEILKKEGFLDVDRALDIFIQAAEAISYAHMKGVIHRDIKPANIIIEKREQDVDFVKLVDFGIAKVLPSQQRAAESLTQTGDIFGTPLYMSPEQCQGNMQDRRSDIYSLGCVMYEALTGVQPYSAENPIKTILKHIHSDPAPIKSLKGDYQIPPDLEQVILRCLQQDPEDRYQTADELLNDLRKVRDGVKIQSGISRQSKLSSANTKKHRLLVVGACGIFTGLALMHFLGSVNQANNAFGDAQDFDSKSYAYFASGQYDKAAPLLEFGVPTYKENIQKDLTRGDTQAALRDKTFLAENWQHIGKCYLMAAKKSLTTHDDDAAHAQFEKARTSYLEAMPFYYEHGSWPGGSTAEAVQGYAEVLKALHRDSDLEQLKSFATKWQITI